MNVKVLENTYVMICKSRWGSNTQVEGAQDNTDGIAGRHFVQMSYKAQGAQQIKMHKRVMQTNSGVSKHMSCIFKDYNILTVAIQYTPEVGRYIGITLKSTSIHQRKVYTITATTHEKNLDLHVQFCNMDLFR